MNQVLTSRDKWLRFTSGEMTGPRPANLRTDRSYTVSAWVRRDGSGGAAVSLADAGTSPFVLGHDQGTGHWSFRLRETPSDGGTTVLSSQPADADKWVHLAASFDAVTGTIAFYVNGVHQQTATGLLTFNGSGGFSVGSGWTGEIDDARVYSGVLTETDVQVLRSGSMHF